MGQQNEVKIELEVQRRGDGGVRIFGKNINWIFISTKYVNEVFSDLEFIIKYLSAINEGVTLVLKSAVDREELMSFGGGILTFDRVNEEEAEGLEFNPHTYPWNIPKHIQHFWGGSDGTIFLMVGDDKGIERYAAERMAAEL